MWGIYWRYLISISLTVLLLGSLDEQLVWLYPLDSNLKPTVFWAVIALIFAAFTLVQNKGIHYFFWGGKSSLSPQVWARFNSVIIMFLLGLALLGVLVANAFSQPVWAQYKLFVQPACLILYPLYAAWRVTKHTKISVESRRT